MCLSSIWPQPTTERTVTKTLRATSRTVLASWMNKQQMHDKVSEWNQENFMIATVDGRTKKKNNLQTFTRAFKCWKTMFQMDTDGSQRWDAPVSK